MASLYKVDEEIICSRRRRNYKQTVVQSAAISELQLFKLNS
jgi:hypothetical protein